MAYLHVSSRESLNVYCCQDETFKSMDSMDNNTTVWEVRHESKDECNIASVSKLPSINLLFSQPVSLQRRPRKVPILLICHIIVVS